MSVAVMLARMLNNRLCFGETKTNTHGNKQETNTVLIKFYRFYALKEQDEDGTVRESEMTVEEYKKSPYKSELEVSRGGRVAKICDYTIEPDFLKGSIDETPINLFFFNSKTNARTKQLKTTLLAFVLIKLKKTRQKQRYLYIDVICAKRGLGGKILDAIVDLANAMRMPKVELTALDKPIAFYRHKGFRFVPGKNSGELEHPLGLFKTKIDEHGTQLVYIDKDLLPNVEFRDKHGLIIDKKAVLATLGAKLRNGGMPVAEFNEKRDAALGRLGKEGVVAVLKGVKLDKTMKQDGETAPLMTKLAVAYGPKSKKTKKYKNEKVQKRKKRKKTKKTRKTRKVEKLEKKEKRKS